MNGFMTWPRTLSKNTIFYVQSQQPFHLDILNIFYFFGLTFFYSFTTAVL